MLNVPDSLNRNAQSVQELGDPADTGLMLINYMCQRIGVKDLDGIDVLDFGCGVRFSQSIINHNLPIGSYTGIEIEKKIVDFLKEHVSNSNFSYYHVDTANQLYNEHGQMLDPDENHPLGTKMFDIACMFSVITHQNPVEAIPIFRFIHKHLKHNGSLFFSAFIHKDEVKFKELVPASHGLKCSYSLPFMKKILNNEGWALESIVDPRPDDLPIMSSFVCKPI